ncbi:hypothetical protein ACIQZB_02155 [Streptomyces sp. NPDC097727]|uniref:hypothetical protein n=1 Tax=Streptomyces sp. NPDC097727 TaxID=3366092 RepID=UPI003819A315
MGEIFSGLDRMDLAAHVDRWSDPEVSRADGHVSQWSAAAEMFASRLQADHAALSDEQWQTVAFAWANLLSAAERSTGPQGIEWLMRDLWLRVSLLQAVGPRDGVPLLEPAPVLDRALDAMPLSREEASVLAPGWRGLSRERMLELRTVRRLLAPAGRLGDLLADHPRWAEYDAWRKVAAHLP